MSVRAGDTVVVIAGKDKGNPGGFLTLRVTVEGFMEQEETTASAGSTVGGVEKSGGEFAPDNLQKEKQVSGKENKEEVLEKARARKIEVKTQ